MELARASLIVAVFACAAACSSEESVADQRQPDGSGASAGAGAAAGSGGGTNDAGFPDAGAPDVCSAYCEALAQSTCDAPPDAAACLQFCQAALSVTTDRGCGDDTNAAIACYATVPASDFVCDANGVPGLPADACSSEHATMDACLCASTCTNFAAVGCPSFSQDTCTNSCIALDQACPACRSDFVSALICQSGQPASAFQCNSAGDVESLPDTCATELSTYQACVAAACPPA